MMSCASGHWPGQSRSWQQCLLALLVMTCGAGCDAAAPTDHGALELQLKLPPALQEVSGLALTDSGTLLAVADEQAAVFEIDLAAATIEPWLAIGQPPLAGDFEGIEWTPERVWLVDSDGVLLWSDGENYERIATGLGDLCEIEGLARDPVSEHLQLLCKQPRSKALSKDTLYLWAASAADGTRNTDADLAFDLRPALESLELKKLQPSGIAYADAGERILIVAARQKALLTFSRSGAFLRATKLPEAGKHRQAEGLSVLPDGRVVIADEGGKKRARLSVYANVF